MSQSGQSYANHTRWFPLFHFFALPVLLINVLWSAWQVVQAPSLGATWGLVVAAALAGAVLASRLMALAVQDRLIRLEMRLRLRTLLPADLHARILDLTPDQLVGLRFASDRELSDLVHQVLGGTLKSSTDIKKAVQDWQGDYLRA